MGFTHIERLFKTFNVLMVYDVVEKGDDPAVDGDWEGERREFEGTRAVANRAKSFGKV